MPPVPGADGWYRGIRATVERRGTPFPVAPSRFLLLRAAEAGRPALRSHRLTLQRVRRSARSVAFAWSRTA